MGHHPILMYPAGGSFEIQYRESGIPCYPLPSMNLLNPFMYWRISKVIRENQVNLIHTHELKSDLIGYLMDVICHIPVVTTIHNMITKSRLSPIKKCLYEWVSRFIYNRIAKVLCVSNAVQQNMIHELGVKATQTQTILNGTEIINPAELTPRNIVRQKLNIPKPAKVLICIGRLIPRQKGQEYLIQAMPVILKKYPETLLLIVGDGDYKPQLDKLTRYHKLENNIRFLGWRKDIHDLLNASNACLIPSLWDPLPRTALEAMMVGVPVIASDVDGLKELIRHEENGLLIKPADKDAISQAVCYLFGTAGLGDTLSKNGRQLVLEHFTSSRHAEETVGVYNSCLKDSI